MSHFATPEGELEEGRPQGSAAGPLGLASDPQFYTALGAVTCSAIEAMFVITDDPSVCGRADGSSVVAGTEPSPTRGPVVGDGSVRANAQDDAGSAVVQGGAPGYTLNSARLPAVSEKEDDNANLYNSTQRPGGVARA